ncbi:hypothetical protein [Sulfurimonas sp.]|uniref:hypothetical protein n=1 Tax=Sulfurimonas sp. TaxID=2022749 RepID=UPI0025F9B67D|nr:hypothetical protein [Sulfurimonas sp.]MBT5934999.1 hypothetical protein [Sulfurimonas sp.]
MLLLLKAITLKSTTPSKRKIQQLLNAREYNSKTMKNAGLDTLQDIYTKDI